MVEVWVVIYVLSGGGELYYPMIDEGWCEFNAREMQMRNVKEQSGDIAACIPITGAEKIQRLENTIRLQPTREQVRVFGYEKAWEYALEETGQ